LSLLAVGALFFVGIGWATANHAVCVLDSTGNRVAALCWRPALRWSRSAQRHQDMGESEAGSGAKSDAGYAYVITDDLRSHQHRPDARRERAGQVGQPLSGRRLEIVLDRQLGSAQRPLPGQ
jgi:hypothetical protein